MAGSVLESTTADEYVLTHLVKAGIHKECHDSFTMTEALRP